MILMSSKSFICLYQQPIKPFSSPKKYNWSLKIENFKKRQKLLILKMANFTEKALKFVILISSKPFLFRKKLFNKRLSSPEKDSIAPKEKKIK